MKINNHSTNVIYFPYLELKSINLFMIPHSLTSFAVAGGTKCSHGSSFSIDSRMSLPLRPFFSNGTSHRTWTFNPNDSKYFFFCLHWDIIF